MSKVTLDLTNKDKWFIGYILGSLSKALLLYIGLTEEEVEEYGDVYHKINKKLPYVAHIDRINFDNPWELVDSRKWNIVRKEDE